MSNPGNRLAPGEKPVIILRQHPIVLFLPLLLNLTAIFLLTALSIYLKRAWFLAFYIVPLTGFLLELLAWYKKKYILTDRRVIGREGLLTPSVLEIPLDSIHKVFHRKSLPGRIFQYGEVLIEASGMQKPVTLHFLARPEAFENNIIRRQEALRHKPESGS